MEGSQRAMCTVNIVKNVSLLSTLLNISVTTESDDIFPSVVCNSCYITVKKAKEDTNILTSTIYQFAWEAHYDFCEICLEVGGDSSGGRLKRKRRPRMMNQLFSVEKLWKELVILTHLNLRISHLTSAFSFLLSIWMISAVTTVIAFPISP